MSPADHDVRNVTWQWVAGVLATVMTIGGGAWMSLMYSEQQQMKDEQVKDRADSSRVREKLGVIEERSRRTEEDIKDIKENQREQNRKLDELLRRPAR